MAAQNGELSGEEYREMMEQQEREREERQTAHQMASSMAMEDRGTEPGYWDTIGDPDIGRTNDPDGDHIEDFLATELSDKFALGNIKHGDWENAKWRTENEMWAIKNEFQDEDSKLKDDDMRMMYGGTRPVLTDEMERRLRSATAVKHQMHSLSIDGMGIKQGTEMHAVAKTESGAEDDDDSGGVSSIKGWLSG